MKKIFLLLPYILLLEISCSVQSTELSEKQKIAIIAEVKDCMDGKLSATSKIDAKAYLDYFSKDNFISVNSNYTYFDSLSFWSIIVKHSYSQRENMNLDQIKSNITVLTPNLVLATRVLYSENLLKSGKSEKVNVATTELWEKKHSEWKITHMHESYIPIIEYQNLK